jgi:ribosome recycling factor
VTESELVELVIEDSRDKMVRAIDHLRVEFSTVRTGRASAALVEGIIVDYYGTSVALKQLAGFSVPEPRMLVVSPYDKGSISSIEKALQSADLGLTPSSDGAVIRLHFPQLTEERRKALAKVVRQKAEEGKIAVRGIRRHARQELETMEKDNSLSTDEVERVEKILDKMTHDEVTAIDDLLAQKEHELLAV